MESNHMRDHLEQQLDEVASYINEYWLFSSRITKQAEQKLFDVTVLVIKATLKRPTKTQTPDFVTGRMAETNKPFWAIATTNEQKQTEFYKAFTSDYPTDAICSDVEEKFPNVDFKKLKKLHDIKKTKKLSFNMKQIFGLVFAGVTLILKTVPKKVVEKSIGIPYEDFEVYLFWYSVLLLGYLLLILVPQWYRVKKASLKHTFVGEILEYIALKKE